MSRPAKRTACREDEKRHRDAELGQDRRARQRTDPEHAHQCEAARLAMRVTAQLPIERGELCITGVDHRQRHRQRLARARRQLELREHFASFASSAR